MTTPIAFTADVKPRGIGSPPNGLFLLTVVFSTESVDLSFLPFEQPDPRIGRVNSKFEADDILEEFDHIMISLDITFILTYLTL